MSPQKRNQAIRYSRVCVLFPYNSKSKLEKIDLKKKRLSERLLGSFRIHNNNDSDYAINKEFDWSNVEK